MVNLYCVRAEFGKYSKDFINEGFVGIGWFPEEDLTNIKNREEVKEIYLKVYPEDSNSNVIGQQVGQISRFLFEINGGDYVITPAQDEKYGNEYIYWGIVEGGYYFEKDNKKCPYQHRKKIKWNKTPVQRSLFSVPFQNTIRSSLTVFSIKHTNNFFDVIGKKEFIEETKKDIPPEEKILERVLELDDKEFEILVTSLLSSMGFEAQRTGKVGDGGVDATGELDLNNIAKIQLYVQAKRYQKGSKIRANVVKDLRKNIPAGAQGAFITTCDFTNDALETATEQGFPRIGTINGDQLIDLLSQEWENIDLPEEIKEKLGLKRGLVLA